MTTLDREAITEVGLATIRDEVGTDPDDTTIEEFYGELGHWLPVAIRVLKCRYANVSAGGQEVSSFGLDGVLTRRVLQGVPDGPVRADRPPRGHMGWRSGSTQPAGCVSDPHGPSPIAPQRTHHRHLDADGFSRSKQASCRWMTTDRKSVV